MNKKFWIGMLLTLFGKETTAMAIGVVIGAFWGAKTLLWAVPVAFVAATAVNLLITALQLWLIKNL